MKSFLLLPIVILTSCGLSDSDDLEDKDEKKVTGPERRIVGRIASVSQVGEFVLIQKFGTGTLPRDTIYQSQGPEGRTASLRPSGERIRDFFAADLLSGKVEKGDAVVAYPDPKKEEEKASNEEKVDNSDSPETSKKLPHDKKFPGD